MILAGALQLLYNYLRKLNTLFKNELEPKMKNKIISVFILLILAVEIYSQVPISTIDTLEFQIGYPNKPSTAIEQLQSYPSPRYQTNNSFVRLFNWMNSKF